MMRNNQEDWRESKVKWVSGVSQSKRRKRNRERGKRVRWDARKDNSGEKQGRERHKQTDRHSRGERRGARIWVGSWWAVCMIKLWYTNLWLYNICWIVSIALIRRRIVKLQFIKLVHFIIIWISRWLPFATLIQPEGRALLKSVRGPFLFPEIAWGRRWSLSVATWCFFKENWKCHVFLFIRFLI